MFADGLTKGSVDRTALRDAMAGKFLVKHGAKEWSSPLARVAAKARAQKEMDALHAAR